MDQTTTDALIERFERLEVRCLRFERQARRWKTVGILAWIGVVMLIAAGARQDRVPKTIEAERFVLRDQDGKTRMELGTDDRKAVALFLLDQEGNRPISLGVTANGRPAMGLSQAGGNRSLTLAFTPIGTAGLTLYDKDLTPRVQVYTAPDGTPALEIRDEGNQVIFRVPEE